MKLICEFMQSPVGDKSFTNWENEISKQYLQFYFLQFLCYTYILIIHIFKFPYVQIISFIHFVLYINLYMH